MRRRYNRNQSFVRGMEFVAALLFIKWIHRFKIKIGLGALLAFGFLMLLVLMFVELAK
jgi:hypothetical protein